MYFLKQHAKEDPPKRFQTLHVQGAWKLVRI